MAGGSADDAAALGAAVALSRRSRHPVSGALASLGASLGARLPDVAVTNFRLVPGQRLPRTRTRKVAVFARLFFLAAACRALMCRIACRHGAVPY